MTYLVKVDVSPIYDLLSSFMIYTTRKWVNNLDIGPEWIDEIKVKFSPEVDILFTEAAYFPFADYDILYALTIERNPSSDIHKFFDELTTTTVEALYHQLKPYIPTVTTDDIERVIHRYIPLLRIWNDTYFNDVKPQFQPLLEEDAAEKNELLHKMDADALLEYATGGLVLEPRPELDKVIIIPSVHFRPINTYCFYPNVLLIQYPIDLPEVNEDEPPTCLIRLTRALANQERLRLLRYIADDPKSLQQMMVDLNQSKDKLMHDLMRLRVAGLLRIHLMDQDTEKFSIRPDGISELNIFLESYMRL
ncbi:ArsR family transcriptional regulator [Paenibacillus segetis]|uniref:ArsR family transcriptional regulator n=1 Tax=Paenibacillus segetis TaxID=1325360 RepID=A0ABQ1YE33_9BACL|nr:ArsR family transcriptional regulator [Paenibacillus segetis]GGH22364.1 hypothetical protein GCM10008013_20790 [Paenibacillus segetis]